MLGLAAVATEVDDMRLMLQEELLKVVGTHRPGRDQLERVAIIRRPDFGHDRPDLFVEG